MGQKRKDVSADLRVMQMTALYRQGKTLHEVGEQFGVSRERVRQLLRRAGVPAVDGGVSLRARQTALLRAASLRDKSAARRQKIEALFGCSMDEIKRINGMAFCWTSLYREKSKTPANAFVRQKQNAGKRGIAWDLTLPQWWDVWQQSGKWDQRGRGQGYCMARVGDSGPYAVDNVYVCTIGQNFSDSYLKTPYSQRFPERVLKTFRVSKVTGNKANPYQLWIGSPREYSGCFPTPAAAEERAIALLGLNQQAA